jgi:hypothetical protein
VKPVTLKDIIRFEQYETLRPLLRPLFIAEKDRRRLSVTDHMTLLFENAQTVWYQVEETLRDLLGLERHVWICIDQRRESVRFDERQVSLDRVSAVQFVRFPLGGLDSAEFLAMADARKLAIEIDHPKMMGRALIEGSMARALAQDLL